MIKFAIDSVALTLQGINELYPELDIEVVFDREIEEDSLAIFTPTDGCTTYGIGFNPYIPYAAIPDTIMIGVAKILSKKDDELEDQFYNDLSQKVIELNQAVIDALEEKDMEDYVEVDSE